MPLENLNPAFDFTTSVIAGIANDQWEAATPCADWDLRALVNHTVGGQVGMAAAAAKTEPTPGFFERDYTGDSPADTYRAAADDALAAWPDALEGMVQVGPFEMPGTMAAPLNLVEAVAHGIDIAIASNQPVTIGDDLAEAALNAAHHVVSEDFRAGGGFAAEREVADDADPIERFLAFVGRPSIRK